MKKFTTVIVALILIISLSFSSLAAVGTILNERELFVAPKAERVMFDFLDGIVNGLVKGIAALMPIPKSWKDKYTPEGFMQGTGEFITAPSETAVWSLGYDSRSLLPENKDDVIGKYYVAGTISTSNKYATSVEDDLLVRTVTISDGPDRPTAVFCTIDSYGMSLADVREIRVRLAGWAKDNNVKSIMISVLHQHSAIDTFGMNGNIWQMALLNPLYTAFGGKTTNGKNPDYMENLFSKCCESIKAAEENMTEGKLYFGTADASKYLNDKRQPYINDPNFNRLRFVPADNSKETWIVTTAIHCVGNGAAGTVVTGDYPYYAEKVINKYGANIMFVLGAEECNNQNRDKDSVTNYDENASRIETTKGFGDSIGKAITAISNDKEIAPLLNIRYKEIYLPVDNGVLLFAAKAGVFENIVRKIDGKWNVISEIGYMEVGEDMAFAIIPGELAPELAYGGCLSAEYSWSGKDWEYPSLQDITGERDLYVLGLANDQIGYIVPDNDYMSMLHEDSKSIEFVSLGKNTASRIVEEFGQLVSNK